MIITIFVDSNDIKLELFEEMKTIEQVGRIIDSYFNRRYDINLTDLYNYEDLTVKELKSIIFKAIYLPVDRQKIIINDKEVLDEQYLSEFNFEERINFDVVSNDILTKNGFVEIDVKYNNKLYTLKID